MSSFRSRYYGRKSKRFSQPYFPRYRAMPTITGADGHSWKFSQTCEFLYTPETPYTDGRNLVWTDNAARIVLDATGNFGVPANEPNLFYDMLSSTPTQRRWSLMPNTNVTNTGMAGALADHEHYKIYCTKYDIRIRSTSGTGNSALVKTTYALLADKNIALVTNPFTMVVDGQTIDPQQLKATPQSSFASTPPALRTDGGEIRLSLFVNHAKYEHSTKETFRIEQAHEGIIGVDTSGHLDSLSDPVVSTIVHFGHISHGNQQTGATTPTAAYTGWCKKTIWCRLLQPLDILNQVKDE